MALRFNDLPQPVRERFVQITTAKGHPLVIDQAKKMNRLTLAIIFGVVGFAGTAYFGWHAIERAQVIDPAYDQASYLMIAASIATLLLGVSSILLQQIWKPPPYAMGMYVFPSYLTRANADEIAVMSLADIGVPNIVTVRRNGAHVHTRLELGGGFTFYHSSDAAAQNAWSRIAEARGRWRAMLAARDTAAIASVDPFWECTVHGAWQVPQPPGQMPGQLPPGPVAVKVPTPISIARWAASILVGLMIAGISYAALDALFEEDRAEYNQQFKSPAPKKKR